MCHKHICLYSDTFSYIFIRRKLMRARAYTTKEVARLLTDNGYVFVRSRGDHFIYKKDGHTLTINSNINKMVARRVIKEAKIKV